MAPPKQTPASPCADLRVLMAQFNDHLEADTISRADLKATLDKMNAKLDDLVGFRWQTIGAALGISTIISASGAALTLFLMWKANIASAEVTQSERQAVVQELLKQDEARFGNQRR